MTNIWVILKDKQYLSSERRGSGVADRLHLHKSGMENLVHVRYSNNFDMEEWQWWKEKLNTVEYAEETTGYRFNGDYLNL